MLGLHRESLVLRNSNRAQGRNLRSGQSGHGRTNNSSSTSHIYPSPTRSVCEDTLVDVFVIPSTCIHGRDIVIAPLVIPSTCIRERDIVVTLLVRVSVSPLNS